MNKETENYIEHEVKIRVLESKNDAMHIEFARINKTFEKIDEKIDRTFSDLRNEIRSNFHWTMGAISILYVSLIGTLVTALAKSFEWF